MNTCECSHDDVNVKLEDESVKRKKTSSKPKWSLTTHKYTNTIIGIIQFLIIVFIIIGMYLFISKQTLDMDIIRSESIKNYANIATIDNVKEIIHNECVGLNDFNFRHDETIDALLATVQNNNFKIVDSEGRIIKLNNNNFKIVDSEGRIIKLNKNHNRTIYDNNLIIGGLVINIVAVSLYLSIFLCTAIFMQWNMNTIIRKINNQRQIVNIPKHYIDNIEPHGSVERQIKDLSVIVKGLSKNMTKHFLQDSL